MKTKASANRLISDPSPYLQQHAYNPVDWYPWGPEAFETARQQDKPIFLSIGYSTCHWCHVMAHESFENPEIARIMNENYISIKVDREARPDIDEVYISAVQAMVGSAGWPLSVFMTADGKPFYGGTYFPPDDSMGRPGFRRVLTSIADAWKVQRADLLESASAIAQAISSGASAAVPEVALEATMLDDAYLRLDKTFDSKHGGFGSAPKFPSPAYLDFLLYYWQRTSNEQALRMVSKTLDAIYSGGIFDQLGGGLHRYATDRQWLVPHFEKMLYDQALVSKCAVNLYQVTRDGRWAQLAREIFDYCLRDLANPSGGFFSGEDADSEEGEGMFYVWDAMEIDEVLGTSDAAVFNFYYGVSDKGNFEGKNILSVSATIMDLEEKFDLEPDQAISLLAACRRKLFDRRKDRPRLGRDEKIITAWNALMISALAAASAALKEPGYLWAAQSAADFILHNCIVDGRLTRFFRSGKAYEKACLDDYAALSLALIDLYEYSQNLEYFKQALHFIAQMRQLFEDKAGGGFYLTARDSLDLIANTKPIYDGAMPSGNSLAALAMIKAARLTDNQDLLDSAARCIRNFSKQLSEIPTSMSYMLESLGLIIGPFQEIVISSLPGDTQIKAMLEYVHAQYLPAAVWAVNESPQVSDLIRIADQRPAMDGRATAYICRDHTCMPPVTDLTEFKKFLSDALKIVPT